MNALQPFVFDGALVVRTLTRNGEPWFVAADVCDALGIQNSRDTLAKSLDEDEKGVDLIYTLGGPQEVAIINESGLYTIILRSREAVTPGTTQHRFRKWITAEVLPAIRRTGGYFLAEGSEQAFLRAETEREIAALKERRHAITLEIRRLEKRHVRLGGGPPRRRLATKAAPDVEAILALIPAEGIRVSALQKAVTACHGSSPRQFYRTWSLAKPHVAKQPDGSVARKGGGQ